MMRQGGETWITGSYDPDVDLTFWGIAQAKPWMPVSRGTRVFDAAQHTASTVALNPDTGALVWRFQHLPGETLDLDEVYEKVAVDVGAQKALFTIGKSGILWKLDRQTGALLDFAETIFQNVYTDIDRKTGRPTYRGDILEQKIDQWIAACPSTEGGHNWQAMSYHPATRRAGHPAQPVVHGDRGAQGGAGARPGRHGRRRGGSSRCPAATATSASSPPTTCGTLKELWSVEQRAPYLTAALCPPAAGWSSSATSIATSTPTTCATGKELWRTRLGTSVQGFPVSFTANGRQYVAVTTGLGGGSPRVVPRTITPEIHHPPTGHALYVFELGAR